MSRFHLQPILLGALVGLPFTAPAQIPSGPAVQTEARYNLPLRWQLTQPAVPQDPLELIVGSAEPLESASQRASVLKHFTDAFRQLQLPEPHIRKMTFLGLGATSSDGIWQLEESRIRGSARWTAQGPLGAIANVYKGSLVYGNRPEEAIPTRLAEALDLTTNFVNPMIQPQDNLRTALGHLNGITLECFLYARDGAAQDAVGGRRWDEAEYCLNPTSGSLTTYSPVPGFYVFFNYAQAIHFHDQVIPKEFVITQAGRTVMEGKTISVEDLPANAQPFDTAGLQELGVGGLLSNPAKDFSIGPWPAGSQKYQAQVVVMHAVRSSSGQMLDWEILAASKSSFIAKASDLMARVQKDRLLRHPSQQPGATPQSREVFQICYFVDTTP